MSLFDIAAGLSQFTGANDDDDHHHRVVNEDSRAALQSRSSALCILDETLQALYDASHGSGAIPSRARATAVTRPTSILSASKSSEELDQRLRELTRAPSSTRQCCQAASSEASTLALQRTASGNDADVAARAVLRQLSDEIDQLSELHGSVDGSSRAVTAANTARFLAEKYINAQLNTLQATPFVQLVRKKALLKIQQLERRESTTASSAAPPAVTSGSAETSAPTVELWRRLGALTAPQHALLQRLARVPDAQMAALPQTQQELAQFARRYEQVRAMSARDIARLQPHQQQIVRQLQRGTQRPLPSLHA